MDTSALVSIIIPCYNYGKYLSQALDSVASQAYAHWECIIVDDGSTDNTADVAKPYTLADNRFKYIYQKNAGLSAARNTGIAASKGKYLQLLDADDMLESNKLKLQVAELESNPDIDLLYSDIRLFDDQDSDFTPVLPAIFSKPRVSGKNSSLIEHLLDDNIYLPGCPLFKRKIFDVAGGFKPSYGFEDWEFWYRAAMCGFAFKHFAPEGTALLVRNHNDNMSKKFKKMMEAKVVVRTEMVNYTDAALKDGFNHLDRNYVKALKKKQTHLLGLDSAFYNLRYGNIAKGAGQLLIHAFPSENAYKAIYEGMHLVRGRMKDKN
ncbi:glycosyltransferase [Mucilaginibacter sp. Bleaf8]|uniref:glycosyltransferase family 2 protein n=1 Tax=Mucilaginibacter sp. Bleaf8 TaxID=2834430 RepID=UPI001BCCCE70|nr:glycosyltransferase [Mucilaginibacter sp. Bleaf8]MBS7562851.1 glycosyltransferase [Mucilaginibacter sp. Bleaf8]